MSAGPTLARAGAATDWAAVRRLIAEAFAGMDGRIDPPSSIHRATAADLAAHPGPCWMALDGASPVACLFAAPQDGALHLSRIAVTAPRRGQGLCRRLVEAAAAEARTRGLPALTLQSRVALTQTHAAFARLGFREVARTAHPGYDRPTSIVFRRDLSP